jgi:hypothetical protein
MKTQSTNEIEAGGINQRFKPPTNAASDITGHFHPDPNGGGWVNDRGIEPLIPFDSTVTFKSLEVAGKLQPVRFLSVITRHQAAETYYLYEQNGSLQYDMGNVGTTGIVRQTSILDTDRRIPKPDDCGTQITTYGRFNLIINGSNRMLKWWGRELVSGFGFTQPTPTGVIAGVDTEYMQYRNSALDNSSTIPWTKEGRSSYLSDGMTCIRFPSSNYYGLGDPLTGAVNRYDYKFTFVTDTGSESPISEPSSASWVVSSENGPSGGNPAPEDSDYPEGKYGVFISKLPVGPQGTVARRIWRTKNRKDGVSGAGEIYYLVTQIDNNCDITYVDITPDQDLSIVAPSRSDSVLISSQWKYCSTFNNSIWLAGGEMNPYSIIYSKPGLPEQFDAFSTFDVGLRDGGAITALVPFYDVLLVFRERSIELITYNNGAYSITTLDSNVGTTATNTIRLVGGVGVMFLNKDGISAVTGSIRGGAVYKVTKMSDNIEKEMGRVSLSALPRATATYSEREKEYWVHYPVDGDTENTRGSVYHIFNNEWSFRFSEGFYKDGRGMPFTCLATDPNGWIIIGLLPNPGKDIANRWGVPGVGLQVWSASRFAGQYLIAPALGEGTTTFTLANIPKALDLWESVWTDFGDDSKKKRVISVEVEVITSGENPISLIWATDWGYTYTSSGTQVPLKPETVKTISTEPSYGIKGGNPAVWDKSTWSQSQVTRIRWDIGTSLISQFKFRLFSSNLIQVLSYQIEAVGSQNKTLNQNGATSRQ